MKFTSLLLFVIFFLSCSKGEKNDFDKNIKYAYDFAVDPNTNDTVYRFAIPNGFTPDGDGINDYFFINSMGVKRGSFKMSIFNRTGETVFSTSELYLGWNGKLNSSNNLCQLGVYNVDITLTDTLGTPHRYLNFIQMFK